MKLLLDTHALLWWLADDDALGAPARQLVADPGNTVLVSVVSLWEIVIKMRIGKLDADVGEVVRAIPRQGFALLAISTAHLTELVRLPTYHRDPFDHLLIAQAIAEDAIFVSEGRHTPMYAGRFVTCSGRHAPSA